MIADSHPEVRAALRLLLEEDSPTWIVAAEASNAIELVNKARQANPRVILVDWDLPGMRVGSLNADHHRADKILVAVKAIAPKAKILVLSTTPEARAAAIHAGADSFLSKDESPQNLIHAIRQLDLALVEAHKKDPWTALPNIPVEPLK